jgi:tetratricopeptide (TPR) repeat protein
MIKNGVVTMALVLMFVGTCCGQKKLSKQQWLTDLEVLETSIYTKHVNPFWYNSKSVFETEVTAVRNYIHTTDENTLEAEKIVTGFAKMLAVISDGHSGINTASRNELLGIYAFNVSWNKTEGFIVLSRLSSEYKEFAGAKVLKYDDTPIEEVKTKIASVATACNEEGLRRFSPRYLESPVVLYGLGITKSPDEVTLTVTTVKGETKQANFKRITEKEQRQIKFTTYAEVAGKPTLFYLKNNTANYWFEYLSAQKTMYVNLIRCQEDKNLSVTAFVKQVQEATEQQDVEKFVLDLRLNSGGDHFIFYPLLTFVQKNEKINQPGKLFILTSNTTFSAATAIRATLESKTNCIIIGTSSADKPVYPAEDEVTVLPNCKMEVRLSTAMWNFSLDGDKRNSFVPDIEVNGTYATMIDGTKDLSLEQVFSYKHISKSYTIAGADAFTGRYRFSLDKTLTIFKKGEMLYAEIPGKLYTPLNQLQDNKLGTEIKNCFIERVNGKLFFTYADGHQKELEKLKEDEFTALDYIVAGKFEKAKAAYLQLKKENPDVIEINGTNLAALALHLYIRSGKIENSKQLVEIALMLDPDSLVAQQLVKNAGKL